MADEIKLTKLAKCAGCGAKVGAGTLSELLQGLPTHRDENLLVGFDTSDDGSVYKISEDLALVQTLDFFPPIVDNPRLFGQIAAANALSDVFAMGGTPKLAMNIMEVSPQMSRQDIHDVLQGGYEKVYEAGAIITGGHTIQGEEPKYGLSVTGFVDPKKMLANSSAKDGDILILTKPLGVGVLTTAIKGELIQGAVQNRLYQQMATLNKTAAELMVKYPVSSCTDITGFGLLGHGYEMAKGSGMTLHLDSASIPYLHEAYELASMGILPEGVYRNRAFAEEHVLVKNGVARAMLDICYDPQTSGGLLISLPEQQGLELYKELSAAIPDVKIIGHVTKSTGFGIEIR